MNKNDGKKTAVIIGAGPAGLTAAYELLHRTDIRPVLLEADGCVGGISRTVEYKNNRMDIGGHRFFSKCDRVVSWWQNILPMQSAPAKDEILLGDTWKQTNADADPERMDGVMLRRRRVSRVLFGRKFFDYPISLSLSTLGKLGLWRTMKVACGYLAAQIKKRPEHSLEDFYINRFGAPLYHLFFEDYTHKVWGVHPSRLGADWGSQRVKGLSAYAIIKEALLRPFRNKSTQSVETSLINSFIYPKYGPGQLWESVAKDVVSAGGELLLNARVNKVNVNKGKVVSVEAVIADEEVRTIECDYLFSTMPLKELVSSLQGIEIPKDVKEIAEGLPYRDFITVGLLLDGMKIKNETKLRTYANRLPDTWIYIQEHDVKVGRIQIFNNWSPYMVADYKNTLFIGLEYFCNEGDELWQISERDFIAMATKELVKMNIIEPSAVLDATCVKMKKAYPAYFGTYKQLGRVRNCLDEIGNLYCLGRNGQHRYNNMDHSMLTAMVAVDNIVDGVSDKGNIWSVNTESEYNEE